MLEGGVGDTQNVGAVSLYSIGVVSLYSIGVVSLYSIGVIRLYSIGVVSLYSKRRAFWARPGWAGQWPWTVLDGPWP